MSSTIDKYIYKIGLKIKYLMLYFKSVIKKKKKNYHYFYFVDMYISLMQCTMKIFSYNNNKITL